MLNRFRQNTTIIKTSKVVAMNDDFEWEKHPPCRKPKAKLHPFEGMHYFW